MIALLDAEYNKDPAQYRLNFTDLQNTAIQYGQIQGEFDYSKQILVGPKTHDGKIGYDALIPMTLSQGGRIFVHMGWVEGEKREGIKTPSPRGSFIITGIARQPDWNRFTPDNSPDNNIWTKLDIDAIAAAKNIETIAPVIFYAQSAPAPLDNFIMTAEKWYPRNKHGEYALFWFGMAFIWIGFFGFIIFLSRKEQIKK